MTRLVLVSTIVREIIPRIKITEQISRGIDLSQIWRVCRRSNASRESSRAATVLRFREILLSMRSYIISSLYCSSWFDKKKWRSFAFVLEKSVHKRLLIEENRLDIKYQL